MSNNNFSQNFIRNIIFEYVEDYKGFLVEKQELSVAHCGDIRWHSLQNTRDIVQRD